MKLVLQEHDNEALCGSSWSLVGNPASIETSSTCRGVVYQTMQWDSILTSYTVQNLSTLFSDPFREGRYFVSSNNIQEGSTRGSNLPGSGIQGSVKIRFRTCQQFSSAHLCPDPEFVRSPRIAWSYPSTTLAVYDEPMSPSHCSPPYNLPLRQLMTLWRWKVSGISSKCISRSR